MATLSDVKNIARQINAIYKSSLATMNSIIDKMAAINPSAPDAKEQLERLRAEYNTVRSNMLSQIQPLVSSEIEAFNTLSEADKEKFNNSSEATQERKYSDQVNQTAARESSVATDIRLAILKATPPPPTPTVPTTNSTNTLQGAASDDSGIVQSTQNTIPKSPNAASAAGGTTPATNNSNAKNSNSAPIAGSANQSSGQGDNPNASVNPDDWQNSKVSKQTVNTSSQPGKRLKNPLGEFSSYTYQLTLYMITPDAYDAFVATGRTKINVANNIDGNSNNFSASSGYSGAFVVAQSGGVNNENDVRAPGFTYDFGIDDLNIKSIHMRAAGSSTPVTEISFNIREPYGFRFLTQLRNAGDRLFGSEMPIDNTTMLRQTFILGIRFIGYDQYGNVMKPDHSMESTTTSGQSNYTSLDPTSTNGSLFEHFLDVTITECKFRIDGKMVTYNMKGIAKAQQDAFKISKGINKQVTTITASTVGDAVDQFMTKLNDVQNSYASGSPRSIPSVYKVVWGPDTEDIWSASIVSTTDLDKIKFPFPASTTADSNASKEVQTQAANPTATTIQQVNDKPIIQVITDIVKQSKFMESQLNILYNSSLQANPDTKSFDVQKAPEQNTPLSWINITPQISNIQYDNSARDFAYTITYFITKYSTPILDTPYASGTKFYPGPHKRYDYWYTGKNTEVMSYEQKLDNTFIQIVQGVGDTIDPLNRIGADAIPSASVAPLAVGLNQTQPRTGRLGDGFNSQNSFLTALYDPTSYLQAKVTIMGDPDYLPVDMVYNEQLVYDQFYNTGGSQYSINASGSQVFVEIDFEEPVDYDNSTGLLSVNEQIAFIRYPDNLKDKIKGVSYQILEIDHNFSNGVFKQTLNLLGNTFGTEEGLADKFTAARNQTLTNLGVTNTSQPNNSNATGTGTGTPSDKPQPTTPNAPAPTAAPQTTNTSPQGTKSNNVANDDSKG